MSTQSISLLLWSMSEACMIRLQGSGIAKVDTDKAQAQLTLFSDSDHPTICNIAKYRKQGKIHWARLLRFLWFKRAP